MHMISAWHLLWIIPVSGMVGVVAAALCHAASDKSRDKHHPVAGGA
jgi:hypothetical protein